MKTPVAFIARLMKNPWFLWFLLVLGASPIPVVEPIIEAGFYTTRFIIGT